MTSIGILIIVIWIILGLYAHIAKHSRGEKSKSFLKKVAYREDGTIEWIYKHKFMGYGSKYFYRKDGSLWLKEDYFLREPMENHQTFYYPSGRVKYAFI